MASRAATKKPRFPYRFEHNGRIGTIYKLGRGTFKSYFRFAGEPKENTHATFDSAFTYLEREFSKLDSDQANALSLHPLNSDVRNYAELERLLRAEGDGATLRDAVSFYLANHKHKKFTPQTVLNCVDAFLLQQESDNVSPSHLKTLKKHLRRFQRDFATRKIHDISALEISKWLTTQTNAETGERWSVKTRISVRGSLVSLSLFARDILKSIPATGKTEFQWVRRPKKDQKTAVEIYSPDEMEMLLNSALENDISMIPVLVLGGFQGLRPAEIHGEEVKRPPLTWEALIWHDNLLHLTGQKVRSKANRDIPLHPVTASWLKPFKDMKGRVWRYKQAHSKKLIALRKKAGVRSIHDGFRHSYASYRIKLLKGGLEELAEEMGNSPREIIDSYKRNVTLAEATAWFSIKPPKDYGEKVKAALASRGDL